MKHRLAAATVMAAAAVAPAAAQAPPPTLSDNTGKRCYGTSDQFRLAGSGFTPGGNVVLTQDGRTFARATASPPAGTFAGTVRLPTIRRGKTSTTYTATDQSNPALVANLALRVSATTVVIRPANARPTARRRITARGFTAGSTLYMHVARGRSVRTVRIGRLRGACRNVTGRKALFGKRYKVGTYRVQFDAFRRYRSTRPQKVVFPLTVRRVFRPAAAGAARAVVAGSGRR